MERGDIYKVSLDPIAGREQNGFRRVLIVSAGKFNRAIGTPLVVPITTGGGFPRNIGFSVPLTGTGLETTGVILCHQARTLDFKARGAQRVEAAPASIVEEVIAKLMTLLE